VTVKNSNIQVKAIGTSYLTSLTVDESSAITGNGLKITVDGAETGIVPNTTLPVISWSL